MITINDTLPVTIDQKLLSVISPDTDKICFFDIETTGFSREYNICYLIGAVYTKNGKTFYNQWLAESDSDEASILSAFNEFVKDYDYIIHFIHYFVKRNTKKSSIYAGFRTHSI